MIRSRISNFPFRNVFSFVFSFEYPSFSTSLVAPKIAPFDFGEEPMNFGEPASVQCLILGGDLPMAVEWLHNQKALTAVHGISLSKIGKRVNVLTIESVGGQHAGNYSCRAKNVAGMTSQSAELIVNGLFFFLNKLEL